MANASPTIMSIGIIILFQSFRIYNGVMCLETLKLTKFVNFYGWVKLHEGYTSPTPFEHQTQHTCATLCFYDSTCSLVEFNSDSGSCTLFYWKTVEMLRVPNDVTTKLDKSVMVKHGYLQLYLRSSSRYYNYDVSEGEGLCQRVGGRLATLFEIQTASANGWDVCGCGWLQNGQPTYVVANLTLACGMHEQVCSHIVPPLYDLHCTIA